jgi:hypothetical protein
MGSYGDYWDYRFTSKLKQGSLIEFVYHPPSSTYKTARALGMVLSVNWHPQWSLTTIDIVSNCGHSRQIRIWQIHWIHKI